jgi:PadR family transcriptional regulator PadR
VLPLANCAVGMHLPILSRKARETGIRSSQALDLIDRNYGHRMAHCHWDVCWQGGIARLEESGVMKLRELELGAVQAHILYHAAQHPIYGSWMAEELARHGLVVSFGTLYPMFHRMHQAGLLDCREQREGSQLRKYYVATPQGEQELQYARHLISELYQEVVEEAESERSVTDVSSHEESALSPRQGDKSSKA